jgi:signal transduction histidine kinase
VLIVDDEFENLVVLEALLEDEGYTVITAEDGQEALEQFKRHPDIDMVITDQRMPRMSGVELLAQVASFAPSTIRVVLTAYSDVGPIVSAVNDGAAYRFLLKPWSEAELKATVADGLRARTQQLLLKRLVEALNTQHIRLVQTLAALHTTHDQQLAAERLGTLGRLTSGITHDVNNHLALIQGVLAEVQDQAESDLLMTSVKDAQHHISALAALMRDVNAFAKSEQLSVEPTTCTTVEFLNETLTLFKLEPSGVDRTLFIEVQPDATQVFADQSRLRQALLALLRNAAHASSDDIRISVYLESTQLVLAVSDTGVGMDSQTVERATTPFFSAFEPKGLGIGLGIARLVAIAHGGDLELESELGLGTTARLRIKSSHTELFSK